MRKESNVTTVKKPIYKKWWFWVIVVIILIGAFGIDEETKDESTVNNTIEATYETQTEIPEAVTTTPVENKKEEEKLPKLEKYSTTITAGYYTGGVQLPVGKYNITLISGSGNAISDGGLNEIFSSESSYGGIDQYNNFKLGYGETLNICGNLKLKLECKEADMESIMELDNQGAKEMELATGNYIAGEDFPAGIYDIIYVKGSGNVFVDGGMIVNEIMGSDANYEIKEFKNCTFTDGTTIELSGVTVKIIPSKCSIQ